MLVAVADTHTVIWYLSGDARLSAQARSTIDQSGIEGNTIGISSITLIEMVYLVEKGRIPALRFSQLAIELQSVDSVFDELPVNMGIARAVANVNGISVPDMPDRIITATASHYRVPIITRDHQIASSGIRVIW